MTGALDTARAVGDAVLYEGYLLYPYRASAAKNRLRWQFGVLVPPSFASADAGEYATSRTECLLEPRRQATLHLRLRFLQAQARQVVTHGRPVPSAVVDAVEYTTWDEALEREVEATLPVAEPLAQPVEVPFTIAGGEDVENLGDGVELVRTRQELTGSLWLRAEPLSGPFGGMRLRVDVRNTSAWSEQDATRERALHHALLAAHVVLAVDGGHFLSLLDPPEWARPAARSCVNERTWPVLVSDDVVLSSPIILDDRPVIAAESAGELFDGTEIDEILTLRTMALTDEEKRQARATDDRARALVDRVDALPPELLDRLHGTVRYLRSVTGETEDQPDVENVEVAGVRVAAGSRVVLRPAARGSDAQDMFLAGRGATVHAVLSDVDGSTYVAVTLDDDPAADLQVDHGRFRYFAPDEIEPREVTG
ncbi:hypothetical protein [Prauserella cavernicola]|uniref:Uncharacterized protein n=1 Tax=Prauserella cavernicola TaxID=2800127 RepID=A0A934QSM9_9PSEU|nr:hypothetical protein [Prauserella cavernicola]MBK1784954.1 hypothetical protein [Prauserella cavernicola]